LFLLNGPKSASSDYQVISESQLLIPLIDFVCRKGSIIHETQGNRQYVGFLLYRFRMQTYASNDGQTSSSVKSHDKHNSGFSGQFEIS
ncbi:hypothetical protein PENTCL1PPCAC_30093, partial [Pristionchus entomophagus]